MKRLFLALAVLSLALTSAQAAPRLLYVMKGVQNDQTGTPFMWYFTRSLDYFNFNYQAWNWMDSAQTSPSSAVLNQYDIVIWDQPDYSYGMSEGEADDINTYLGGGKKLFLTGMDFIYSFLSTYGYLPSWLHVDSYTEGQGGMVNLAGVAGDSLSDGLFLPINLAARMSWDGSDVIVPGGGAVGCLAGLGGPWIGDICGLRFQDPGNGHQVVFLAAPFAAITDTAMQDTLLSRVMDWFGYSPYGNWNKDVRTVNIERPAQPVMRTNTTDSIVFNIMNPSVLAIDSIKAYAVVETVPGAPPIYRDSIMLDLPPKTGYRVALTPWVANLTDTVTLTCGVALPDSDGNPANDLIQREIAVLPLLYFTDFEQGRGRWTGDWQLTDELANSGVNSLTDLPDRVYPSNSDLFSSLDTAFSLVGYASAVLQFQHCHWIEPVYDHGYVMVSGDGGSSWDSLAAYNGCGDTDTLWHPASIDLSSYLGAADVRIGFRMGSDPLRNMRGWFIDDVMLLASNSKELLEVTGEPAGRGAGRAIVSIGPNPARGSVSIVYQTDAAGPTASIRVYNLSGQLVRTVEEGTKAPGLHTAKWNVDGRDGRKVASGVYIVRSTVGGHTSSKSIIVLR